MKKIPKGWFGFLAVVLLSAAEKIMMDRETKRISTRTTLDILEHFNVIEKKDKNEVMK
mgnify:CR=1 FL=1